MHSFHNVVMPCWADCFQDDGDIRPLGNPTKLVWRYVEIGNTGQLINRSFQLCPCGCGRLMATPPVDVRSVEEVKPKVNKETKMNWTNFLRTLSMDIMYGVFVCAVVMVSIMGVSYHNYRRDCAGVCSTDERLISGSGGMFAPKKCLCEVIPVIAMKDRKKQ